MFRTNNNLNYFLKRKIKLFGREIFIIFYLFTAILKEIYALPTLDEGLGSNFNMKLSDTFTDHNTASEYCHSMYNGQLLDIQWISDLYQLQRFLENNHGNFQILSKWRIEIEALSNLEKLSLSVHIGNVRLKLARRSIAYSYLYVNENWQQNLQRIIYGNDGRCSSRLTRIATPQSRVVGGGSATYGSQPWQVEIAVIKNGSYHHHCSGIILTPVFILTAAHCFEKATPLKLFRVTTGDYEIGAEDEYEHHYEIEKLVIHPNHRTNEFDNDIAIIKLKSENDEGIHFGSHVLPACIPNDDTPHTPGTSCVVSGWGIRETEANSQVNTSAVLQSAQVELLSTTTCREVYKNYSSVSLGMICAGHWDGRIDSCRGDSGGPLVCDVNGQNLVFGLVSWGQDCGKPNRPGVYVHVQHYLKWIHQMVEELG